MTMRAIILAMGLLAYITPTHAQSAVKTVYLQPQTAAEQRALTDIQNSEVNAIFSDLSDDIFPFKQPVTLKYDSGDGPLYDPRTHTVHIPYRFYIETLSYFTKNQYQEKFGKPAKDGALDTLLHTLLHEAGHAYIADQKIPILGKEEDAADNFATILLLNYIEAGDDIAISAADMFAFESEDRPDYYDVGEYIDEHSFDLQRYFSTLCLVYGSDPETYKHLLDEVEKDYLKDRKDFCVENFAQVNDSWHQYLKPTSN
jgi:hypothetical protein